MAMKLTKDTSAPMQDAPEAGNHEARIVGVIFLGTHDHYFQGAKTGEKPMIDIVFELTDEQDDGGHNKVLARDYTFSGHEKAGLTKLCQAALGPMPEGGYDMEALLNQPVMVNVDINEKGYANVGDVTPLREQQKKKVGALDNVPLYWDFETGADYLDHDWVPWIYSRAIGKRVKVSEMIAMSKERKGSGEAMPAGAGKGETAV